MDDNCLDIYNHYLKRLEQTFGDLAVGDTVQHQGKLIRKLAQDEFVANWNEYQKLEIFLRNIMSSGATLNDDIYQKYLELSALVLVQPKDFLTL